MPDKAESIDLEEPLRGVVVLGRADFERNLLEAFGRDEKQLHLHRDESLAVGYRAADETVLRATELAGRANQPGVIGIVATLDRQSANAFSGSLFIVAESMDLETEGRRLLVTEFDV